MTSTLRRIAALGITAAVLGLTACSSSDDVPSADNPVTSVSPSTSAPSSAAPTSAPEVPVGEDGTIDYCADQAPATGPVADQFGAQNVTTAYCEMVAFTLDESSWIDSLLEGRSATLQPVEFSFVKDWMTASMADAWDAQVQAALANPGGPEEQAVQTLTFFGITGENLVLSDDFNRISNKRFSPAELSSTVNAADQDVLVITFTASADVKVEVNGEDQFTTMTKTITYNLVASGRSERPWLIDGYTGSYTATSPEPRD